MTILNIIYTVLIGPLELFFEVIYTIANRFIGNYGLSIIVLSLLMNFLVLPLYKRADAMQDEERIIEEKLHEGVSHIKRTFSGDERMMILQTYYRQNNYKPTDVIKGSVSLFLEIPFFIAAYNFLSNLACIKGISFGPISDLGMADGLINVMDYKINLLPLIMTAVNLISCAIFTKGFPKKTKIQLYGMAIFFLFFLYDSPSALVFYWTLNNIFSLVKTIFYKLDNPKFVLSVMSMVVGCIFVLGFFAGGFGISEPKLLLVLGVFLMTPILLYYAKNKRCLNLFTSEEKPDKKMFWLGALFLTIMCGILIPSSVIKSSPQEFVDLSLFLHPNWYVVSALCYAIGTFLIWMNVFFELSSEQIKNVWVKGIWTLGIAMLVEYMLFAKNLGTIKSNLSFESTFMFSGKEKIINIIVWGCICCLVYFCLKKGLKQLTGILVAVVLAIGGMSGYNMIQINSSIRDIDMEAVGEELPTIELSRNGKNVVVIMLDRGMGEYVPYIMNEKKDLKNQFKGFTYYNNVISFGPVTNFASPALYGGYEYTPLELNKRETESLADKQTEALKVMPVLFEQQGYGVTVWDPTYANYEWIPDLSIYDEYPNIKSAISMGAFSDLDVKQKAIDKNKRNFFCYSVMKTMPLVLQGTLYAEGTYNESDKIDKGKELYNEQTLIDLEHSAGIYAGFMRSYDVLKSMESVTKIDDKEDGYFFMMSNDTTHEPMLLQEPEYEPAMIVDNSEYEKDNADRFSVNGRELSMDSEEAVIHYHANMAAFLQLGKWFDYLRDQGVYDNTKIIIVSDHGRPTHAINDLFLDDTYDNISDVEIYFPLLLVKDFNSKEYVESDIFMTNADVPTIALEGIVDNPINPYTGKEINNHEKYLHDQYVFGSLIWRIDENNGNTFMPGRWYSVKDSIWDVNNWTILQENSRSPFEIIQ